MATQIDKATRSDAAEPLASVPFWINGQRTSSQQLAPRRRDQRLDRRGRADGAVRQRRRRRRGGAGGGRGVSRLARDAAAAPRAHPDALPRAAGSESEGAGRARQRGARQGVPRRDGIGAARHRGGRVRLRRAAPAEGRARRSRSAAASTRYSLLQPVGVCAGITPFNFPGDGAALDVSDRAGVRQHLRPEAVGEGSRRPAIRMAELLKEAGCRTASSTSCTATRRRSTRILHHPGIEAVSFVGSTPIAKYIYATAAAQRQARAGARRRQEPRRGAARCRPRVRRRRADRRRLRIGGRALHGDLGGRRGRRGRRSRWSRSWPRRREQLKVGAELSRGRRHGAARHRGAPRQGARLRRRRRRRRARRWSSTAAA